MSNDKQINSEIVSYYQNAYSERDRLSSPGGQLEFERTLELIQRHMPSGAKVILDVGGGAGVYSFALADLGYEVHLIDAVPLHIEQAKDDAKHRSGSLPVNMTLGDARCLDFPDESADAVLLLGPLYHLTERIDRLAALQEAWRVLRNGGIVYAAAISRYASTLDGMFSGLLHDEAFLPIVRQDLETGQHRNPQNHPAYFTTSFFHHPDELKAEVEEAGFETAEIYAIEGPAWLIRNKESFWSNADGRQVLLEFIRAMETEQSILGASAHIMAIARKAKR